MRTPSRSVTASFHSCGAFGLKKVPIALCSSVLMKFSHSCRRRRSMLPVFGARPESGFWSARYCTIAGPSVSNPPPSSPSAGT